MRSSLNPYLVSLVAVAVAVVVRVLLDPVLNDRFPVITLLLAVSVAARYGGTRPGLLALLVGGGAAKFFLLAPRGHFAIAGADDQVGLALYGVCGFALIAMFASWRKALQEADRQRLDLEREVTTRRATEQTLAEQAEHLQTTLASIGDAVITTDVDARITNMNAVAESLTAWTTADAMGHPLDVIFRIVNETTRLTVESPVKRALAQGAIVGLANHTVLLAKDGTERPIDDSAAPIRRTDGVILGCVLVFRDISERHQQQAALEERERQFHTLAESIPQLAWMAHADGHIFWYNRRWFDYTGTTLEQMEGWGWQIVHDPLELPKILARWQACIATGTGFDMTFPLKAKDGQFRPFLTRVEPVRDATGQVVRWFGTNTDITAQSLNEEALRHLSAKLSDADRRKDEFLATLAHELRNPLAPLRNGLQVMALARGQDKVLEQTRLMMERQLTQMVRLIDDLMDVSRITRGHLELRKERVSVPAVLHNALDACRPLIEEMGHALTITVPELPLMVDGDMTRLSQVFINLLNNAAKYSDPGGRIHLQATQHGSDVLVRVTDAGIGIAADQLPRIFDMFAQVHQSLEKSQGGLGIGLALTKRLVEMHGGSIEALSQGPGHGSEFVVRLPVFSDGVSPDQPRPDEKTSAVESLRILVVDDNRDSADSLATMLRMMGNDTRTAYDGKAGVGVAESFRPDVIMFDIGLPTLNGYEAGRRIREQSWGQHVVLIAMTGFGQDDDRRRSVDAGFDHHLVKPVDSHTLLTLLAGVSGAMG